MALALLAHALRMLILEPATTFRVVLPGLALVLGASWMALTLVPETLAFLQQAPDEKITPAPQDLFLMLAFTLAALFGYALMAILWHRHVLLNGPARDNGLRPPNGVIASYVWKAIIVSLIQVGAAIPIGVILSVMSIMIGLDTGGPPWMSTSLISVVGSVLFLWIALRISMVLPGAAMDRPLGVTDSWAATAPLSGALVGIALLLSLLNVLSAAVVTALLPEAGTAKALIQTFVLVLEGLIFVSVLTTLYGHLIEKRPLS